jgi:c-di-AMP phosphodiesterase-like protein
VGQEGIQTNFRLPPHKYAVLEAAAYVHRAGSVQKLVRQLVEEAIENYAQLSTVQKALEAQREQAATNEGKLALLSKRQRGER